MEATNERRRSKPAKGRGGKTAPAVSLGSRLIELREMKNLSRQQVAEAISGTRENVRKLETGITKSPGLDVLSALARLYNVSITDLVGQ